MGAEDVETSIHQGPMGPSGRSARIQHLSAATGLILTYLIEAGVQVFLTIQFWRSAVTVSLDFESLVTVILSLAVSSLLVTTVSLLWVCHSLDFAGRACGRLLCYVMHVFQLGIPWRYLKLAFAYDPTDVQEFVALRIFQTYVQSLPLTSIHLATLLTFQQNWTTISVWLVFAECISIVVALIIASYATPLPVTASSKLVPVQEFQKSSTLKNNGSSFQDLENNVSQLQHSAILPKRTTRCFQDNLKCSTAQNTSTSDESVLWCRVLKIELNILSRALLLIGRIGAIALLLSTVSFWTIILVVIHLFLAGSWVSVRERDLTWTRSLEVTCVTFWDITSTLCGEVKLVTWLGPVALAALENCAIIGWNHWNAPGENPWVFWVAGIFLAVGWALFSSLNFSKIIPWRTLFGTRVQKIKGPCSLAGETKLAQNLKFEGSTASNIFASESKYTNMNEKFQNKEHIAKPPRNGQEIISWKDVLISANATFSLSNYKVKRLPLPITESLEPRAGHVESCDPDTCCNDSNGSSNSRNTNTLLDITPPDDEVGESDFVFFPQKIPKASHPAPVQIKTASRVIMNIPKHGRELRSRCPCQDSVEEKLIEVGSYGILFCESASHGDRTQNATRNQSARTPNRLRVLCAKCLQNHDPLLTACQEEDNENFQVAQRVPSITVLSETTDYPSETEMTYMGIDVDEIESEVTSLCSSPPECWNQRPMWSAMLNKTPSEAEHCRTLPKEFTSREYVKTWLFSSQTLQRHYRHQQDKAVKNSKPNTIKFHPYNQNFDSKISNFDSKSLCESARETEVKDKRDRKNKVFYKDLEIIV